jgi:hypothetical protein
MCTPGLCDKVAGMIRQRQRRRPEWAAGLALLGFLAVGPARADEASLLASRVAEAQKLVEKVRGLSFRAPVASALLPEKDLEGVLAKKLVEDLPVPFETYAASLEAIGLIESSPDLLLRLTRLYARQVVGFYDPAEKRFYIVPERSRDTAGPAGELMEQLLLAHELTHALQDQRLGLDRRMKSLMDSTDALLALQAVLEGEATLLMTEALMASIPADAREALGTDPTQQILDGLDSPAAVEGAEGVPEFFVKELVFPYAAGTAWVRQKRKEGGWAAMDAVYRNLPSTTSEILRPGTVPGPRKRLAASDRPRPGRVPGDTSKTWYDTLGEWALGSLLERAGAGDGAKEAAAGWQDDRVVFFTSQEPASAGGIGFLWRIRAGSPAAAKRIAALLAPLYGSRPVGRRPTVTTRGDVVEVSLAAAGSPAT